MLLYLREQCCLLVVYYLFLSLYIYQHFGSIDAANSSDGRTSTHEIGHYLGLSHTFCENGGGCCDNDNNSWFGLNVDDTPATDDVYFGSVNSTTNNNTCNDLNYGFSGDLLDMDENFMSYASNTWMFSNGQVDVMLIVLNATTNQGGRKNLWNNSNVTVNCLPTSTNDIITNHNINIYQTCLLKVGASCCVILKV